jgi:hypothetical protein
MIAEVSAVFTLILAGAGTFFFTVMFRAKHDRTDTSAATGRLKHRKFIKRYGFLTSKMRDEYYYWECIIIIRKLGLNLVTKYSADSVIRQSLCNLAVLITATTAHVFARPFTNGDANLVELYSLFSTMVILLIGLGSESVQQLGGSQSVLHISKEQEAQNEMVAFNIISYLFMTCFLFGTYAVIAKRICMLYNNYKNQGTRDATSDVLDDRVVDMLHKTKIEAAEAWHNDFYKAAEAWHNHFSTKEAPLRPPRLLFHTPSFSEWDERGIPTLDADGKEISEKIKKKLEKRMKAAVTNYKRPAATTSSPTNDAGNRELIAMDPPYDVCLVVPEQEADDG